MSHQLNHWYCSLVIARHPTLLMYLKQGTCMTIKCHSCFCAATSCVRLLPFGLSAVKSHIGLLSLCYRIPCDTSICYRTFAFVIIVLFVVFICIIKMFKNSQTACWCRFVVNGISMCRQPCFAGCGYLLLLTVVHQSQRIVWLFSLSLYTACRYEKLSCTH